MKTLIIGKNGQVGHELQQLLNVHAIDFPEIDLSNPDSIRSVIRDVNPSVIINAAAYTAVDKAESEPDRAIAINGKAPEILAEEAKKRDAFLIHYSTEYVYDGASSFPYKEDAATNPLSVYGRSKLMGDQAIMAIAPRHLILRTSWVYGSRGHNFFLTMLKLAKERDSLRIVNDQTGAPTWCRELAKATVHALNQAQEKGIHGLYHLAAGGKTTWFSFAEAIFKEAGLNPKITPIKTEEYPLPAARPKNSCLDQSKFATDFGHRMPDWNESLRHCMVQK